MTNDEKLKWLNERNAHLAAGGKVERRYYTTGGYSWRDNGEKPCWDSDPENWRIVPIPRKATIRVAYRWGSDSTPQYLFVNEKREPSYELGWKFKEIEITEES
jgi:hypothetical protein